LLDRLRRERGIALLFVSHDLNVVRLLCSRIIVMYLGQVDETGPADELYRNPRPPYTQAVLPAIPTLRGHEGERSNLGGDPRRPSTQALLSAIPTLRGREGERIKLEGDPQSPINPAPDQCRFYGRCPIQQELCTRQMPALRRINESQEARCHFAT